MLNQIHVLLILLVTFLPAGSSFATAKLDLDQSYRDLVEAILDRPDAAYTWAKEKKSEITEADEVRWVRLQFVLLFVANEISDPEIINEEIKNADQAKARAWHLKMWPEYTKISFLSQTAHSKDLTKDDIQNFLQSTSQELESVAAPPSVLAELYNDVSTLFWEKGERALTTAAMSKALALITKETNADDIIQYSIKNWAAAILLPQKEVERSRELFREVVEFCRRKHVRYFCAAAAHNLAASLAESGDAAVLMEADTLYREVIRTAREIEQTRLAAFALTGHGRIYKKMRRYNEAHQLFDEAIQLFEKLKITLNIADIQLEKARIYALQDNIPKALKCAEQALVLYPDDLLDEKSQTQKLLLELRKKSGRPMEALEAAEQLIGLQDMISKKSEAEQLNKLKVELGLELEGQKNMLLKKENELQAKGIQDAERKTQFLLLVSCICLLVLILILVIWIKNSQARSNDQKMRHILSSIEEGIMIIDEELRIKPPYSQHLKAILKTDVAAHKDLVDVLFPGSSLSADAVSLVVNTLRSVLGEQQIAWDLNSSQLPTEIVTEGGSRILSLDWQPFHARDGRIHEILICIRDITSRKAMERKIESEEKELQSLQERIKLLVKSRQIQRIRSFILELSQQVDQTQNALESAAVNEAFHTLHTWKGNARSLGLPDLANAVHEIEALIDLKSQTIKQPGLMKEKWAGFKHGLAQYHHIVFDILASNSSEADRPTLHSIVAQNIEMLRGLLKREGIELQFMDVIDHVMEWDTQEIKAMREILLHGLTNCADHGFILAKKNGHDCGAAGIEVVATRTGGRIELQIHDNGAGLDVQSLKAAARERGLLVDSDMNPTDLVFMDGLSTAPEASLTSGRGVGMGAIRDICRELGAEVQLLPNKQGRGTTLQIHWFRKEEQQRSA